jgi:two-component system, chemotaxis family, CheB/CheR fusion protein
MSPEEVAANQEPGEPSPALLRLLEKLSSEHHFDFREYKVASLARRIQTRMSQVGIMDPDAYITHLDQHPEEAERLFNTILINVTGFFRDPPAWDFLDEHVVPRLIDAASSTRSIRVWSAGCASGEEAYTVAMLLAEGLGDRAAGLDIKIYGTDVDDEALGVARRGVYRSEQLKDLPAGLLDRYFRREANLYRFRRDLRRWCIFGRHNLVQDPPLSHLDLIVCRNLLIYLKTGLQQRLLPRFHYALRGRGVLFLGKSESLLARSRWFTPLSAKWRIFERVLLPAVRPDAAVLRAESESTAIGMAREAGEPAERLPERVLDQLPIGVMVVEADDSVRTWNAAMAGLFEIPPEHAVGRKFRDLDISYRAEGLRARVEEAKAARAAVRLEDVPFARRSGLTVHADVRILPLAEGARFLGLLITAVDVSEHARLRDEISRVAEQHATATEELQSTNEELETTNEELESTNEELETTNEELQSTNEELLATVDELQAINSELQRLALYHASVVQSVDHAIVVLDRAFMVTSWNQAAETLWRLTAAQAIGRDFFSLPIGPVTDAVRDAARRIREGAVTESPIDVPFVGPGTQAVSVLRLLPLNSADGQLAGILALTLGPDRARSR